LHHVYVISNSGTTKKYIGKTSKNLELYLGENLRRAARGSRNKPALFNAMRKYTEGWQIESLFEFEDEKQAYRIERMLIALFDTRNWGYNIGAGGEGVDMTPEVRSKIGVALREQYATGKRKCHLKGRPAWNKGIKTGPLSVETRRKMSRKHVSNKHRQNLSIAAKRQWASGRGYRYKVEGRQYEST
jgi:hypothetical protein